PENHGARRTGGWWDWWLPDKRVVDRGRRHLAHAASIPFRIRAPETPDRLQSEECTSGVRWDENQPSVQTGTAVRQASARTYFAQRVHQSAHRQAERPAATTARHRRNLQ